MRRYWGDIESLALVDLHHATIIIEAFLSVAPIAACALGS